MTDSYQGLKTTKQTERERQEAVVLNDISKIRDAVLDADVEEAQLLSLHREMDGKYQSCIKNWGKSMWGYNSELGFNYEFIGKQSLLENLQLMKPKLEAFVHGWNHLPTDKKDSAASGVNVTVNTNINLSVNFEAARNSIEEMTALNRQETDEILGKINELESIAKEQSSRKTKWEKVKPILAFVMDKGADVAVTILALIVQMKLGLPT